MAETKRTPSDLTLIKRASNRVIDAEAEQAKAQNRFDEASKALADAKHDAEEARQALAELKGAKP